MTPPPAANPPPLPSPPLCPPAPGLPRQENIFTLGSTNAVVRMLGAGGPRVLTYQVGGRPPRAGCSQGRGRGGAQGRERERGRHAAKGETVSALPKGWFCSLQQRAGVGVRWAGGLAVLHHHACRGCCCCCSDRATQLAFCHAEANAATAPTRPTALPQVDSKKDLEKALKQSCEALIMALTKVPRWEGGKGTGLGWACACVCVLGGGMPGREPTSMDSFGYGVQLLVAARVERRPFLVYMPQPRRMRPAAPTWSNAASCGPLDC